MTPINTEHYGVFREKEKQVRIAQTKRDSVKKVNSSIKDLTKIKHNES